MDEFCESTSLINPNSSPPFKHFPAVHLFSHDTRESGSEAGAGNDAAPTFDFRHFGRPASFVFPDYINNVRRRMLQTK
jgi:hypothetical protein